MQLSICAQDKSFDGKICAQGKSFDGKTGDERLMIPSGFRTPSLSISGSHTSHIPSPSVSIWSGLETYGALSRALVVPSLS